MQGVLRVIKRNLAVAKKGLMILNLFTSYYYFSQRESCSNILSLQVREILSNLSKNLQKTKR